MEINKSECPVCEGTGWIEYTDEDGFEDAHECEACEGTGKLTLKFISDYKK